MNAQLFIGLVYSWCSAACSVWLHMHHPPEPGVGLGLTVFRVALWGPLWPVFLASEVSTATLVALLRRWPL